MKHLSRPHLALPDEGVEDDSTRYQLLGDQPYVREDDPFGFADVARELRSLILRSREATPFTIGIEASWGRGKSSLMGQLNRELERVGVAKGQGDGAQRVEVRTVSFNAWTAEGSDVLEGLIKSVLDAMDPNAIRRALRNERFVSAIRIPLLVVGGWLGLGRLADEVWEKLSVDARRRNQINNLIREAMVDWRKRAIRNAVLPSMSRLLVVFIDDLDRCSPDNVLKVFEALKLYLDAPGFVFIIGYDQDVVSEAVLERKGYSKQVTGRDYIEKIVQIVFRVPGAADQQMDDLLERYLGESRTATLFDKSERKLLIERNSRNPRRIKRFVNRFILEYRLDNTSKDFDPELLIKLLIFEAYFPEFAVLFDAPAAKNPIQEFLDYAAVRPLIRRGNTSDPLVLKVLRFYEEDTMGEPRELLGRLDQVVPELFVRLVQDEGFVSLTRTLENSQDQELLLLKVQRRLDLGVRQVEGEVSIALEDSAMSSSQAGMITTPPETEVLTGARILWIDDHPEHNARVVEWLQMAGVTVYQTENGDEAIKVLQTTTPDILISDITRGEQKDAGFDDLERIQTEGAYVGPVVFYATRISASRRTRAQKAGALITAGEESLKGLLASEIKRRRAPSFKPPEAA